MKSVATTLILGDRVIRRIASEILLFGWHRSPKELYKVVEMMVEDGGRP